MKNIPIALQSHLDQDATTLCLLCRVETKDGTVIGFTSLDADVTYDDGNGPVTYRADNGFTPERLQTSADMAVDNTDLIGWISADGITEQQIRAGLFDYAAVSIYRVNYADLSNGHETVMVGTCGETKFSNSGWKTEFRSLTQQLKQPISRLYSLTCRAKFGDAQCGKAFTWVNGTVTDVGVESDRLFADSGLVEPDGHFVLGVVEFLTGNNAGAQMEVDAHEADAITLALPLAYVIQVGDTYRVRQDCDKTFTYCKDVHANTLNFRGEHLIPIGDAGAGMIPGAQIKRA